MKILNLLNSEPRIVCISVLILVCIGTFSIASESVNETDCLAARKGIQNERNILKKRDLIQESIQQCSSDPIVNYHYAYILERLRKYEKALKHYIKASELDKQNSDYFFGMADIYMVLGNVESAVWAYEKGLERDRDNKRAQSKLDIARIKYKSQTGDVVTAKEVVQVMQEKEPPHSTVQSLEGPVLRMQIPYEKDSTSLSNEAKSLVDIVGRALQDETLREARFEVIGHSDSSGDKQVNLQFSKRRAEVVKKYLTERHQINPERLIVKYYGGSRPIMPNNIEANRAVNRRVEFRRIAVK